jgi:hypothetical protein
VTAAGARARTGAPRFVAAVKKVSALRDVLTAASYDEATVRELVRVDGLDFGRGLAALRLRPNGSEPLALLVRLFLGGETLPLRQAEAALAPVRLHELGGILARTANGVRARVRLDPVGEVIVASDPTQPGRRLRHDYVVLPGPASRTLAALTVRSPSANALDLCCGSGVQALLAASHCGRVVGTDVSARALALAAVSAGLSGVENVEWRRGDLLEPVREERFGLVVSNPPFVIGPRSGFVFRDAGMRGDELSRRVVRGVAGLLAEDGFGHVLCSWVWGDGEAWFDAPARWLDGSGCDLVVLRLDSESPATHALRWTSGTEASPSAAVAEAAAWVDYYATLGIERIVTGVVVMRRREGRTWTHADDFAGIRSSGGEHLLRIFSGNDALAGLGDDALRGLRLSVPDQVRVVERRAPAGPVERARLTVRRGLQLGGAIEPPTAAPVVDALDGQRTLAEAARRSGVSDAELAAALPSFRMLVRRGYLVAEIG